MRISIRPPHSSPPARTGGVAAVGPPSRHPMRSHDSEGFGAVIEQERALLDLTDRFAADAHGPDAAAIARVLRTQYLRIDDNIALLRQRYESLPYSGHFGNLQEEQPPPADLPGSPPEMMTWLQALVNLHHEAIQTIETLMARKTDGPRGELILIEVVRNHRTMIRPLTDLLHEDGAIRSQVALH